MKRAALFLFQIVLFLMLAMLQSLPAQSPSPDATISTFQQLHGFHIGEQPATIEQISGYLTTLDRQSERMVLVEYGKTYENRPLQYAVISSAQNIAKLSTIQKTLADLADPRKTDLAHAQALAVDLPAVVWLAFSIHGDELSGCDAALQVVYNLTAGTDSSTRFLLDQLIVIIDPSQNPDGRMRWLQQLQQWQAPLANSDVQSIHHSGVWPYGRGNHYFFDMNRDFLPLVHEETRRRVAAMMSWNPQVVVDVHEMGPMDTYLFSPPREPLHPLITDHHKKWWALFSRDQAAAFDRQGWRYYTRDWSESWYPGYMDALPLFTGALGILYEQAGVDGSLVKQYDGVTLSFSETVQHQAVSCMANLTTAATRRLELLKDFYQQKSLALKAVRQDRFKCLLLDPTSHLGWTAELLDKLLTLNMEVRMAAEPFVCGKVVSYWQPGMMKKTFSKGTLLIAMDQPLAGLVHAYADFDPRMKNEFLQAERRELEKFGRTRIYDVTAWSLPIAFNLEAYWSEEIPNCASERLNSRLPMTGEVIEKPNVVAFLIDSRQDQMPQALARLLQKNRVVYAAADSFRLQDRSFGLGSLLLYVNKNDPSLREELDRLAHDLSLQIFGAQTGLSERGSDLGSSKFVLLKKPKIGLLGNQPASTTNFGETWHLLEQKIGYPFSILDMTQIQRLDLSVYNTLFMPTIYTGPAEMATLLTKSGMDKLRNWIDSGGTLIAVEAAAAFVADSSSKLSQVRPRLQVLAQLDGYQRSIEQRLRAEKPMVDSMKIWDRLAATTADTVKAKSAPAKDIKELQEREAWMQRFRPRGTILAADLDVDHWLAAGLADRIPVLMDGPVCLMAKDGVQIPALLADRQSLRISGLLWPEARERWARTAFATRESRGRGQIILFAGEPTFRGYFMASERMLLNAIFLGPGMGTSPRLPE